MVFFSFDAEISTEACVLQISAHLVLPGNFSYVLFEHFEFLMRERKIGRERERKILCHINNIERDLCRSFQLALTPEKF